MGTHRRRRWRARGDVARGLRSPVAASSSPSSDIGLVVDPQVMLADELTAELDSHWKTRVVSAVFEVARHGGIVVVATHDPEIAALCDRVVALADGRVGRAGDGQ